MYWYKLQRFNPETDELIEEVELRIEADYYPPCPGGLYEPPSGPGIEIYDVRRADTGETFLLTDQEEEEISKVLLQQADDWYRHALGYHRADCEGDW